MPQYTYRGRNKEGALHTGERFAVSEEALNSQLIKEGISVFQMKSVQTNISFLARLQTLLHSDSLLTQELAVFTRQMQLLHDAGVPITTALNQLANHTRSVKLKNALLSISDYIEKGQGLAVAMQHFPDIFSPLMTNIIQIGENTGQLGESFTNLNQYLEFEARNSKQIKEALRYPTFVMIAIGLAIIVLNIFVIPTFARFYTNLKVALPWQTQILISTSNFFVHYGFYLLLFLIAVGIWIYKYLKTPTGRYNWDKYILKIPLFGQLLKRMILIRFCQSLAIILNSGISVTQGLVLVKNIIVNAYITDEITQMQASIERGVAFTQAVAKINLFEPLEIQILSVGEKNGELSPALNYICNFHKQEIEYDLKRMSDFIGPLLIGVVSVLVLIMALGIYLPIWNMIDSVHS